MPYFLVFQIDERTTSSQETAGRLKTFASPLAAFHADSGEEACQAAAAATKRLTTYFAIEGTPWGVDMMRVDGTYELGVSITDEDETPAERRLRALERRVLDRDVPED